MDYVALKNELLTDPQAIGYGAPQDTVAYDENAATLINRQTRAGDAVTLTAAELLNCLDWAEYDALGATNKAQISLILQVSGNIPVGTGTAARRAFVAAFAAGTNTRRDFNKATRRTTSRAEELGLGVVTPSDIAMARKA